jgi:hypothetical protein
MSMMRSKSKSVQNETMALSLLTDVLRGVQLLSVTDHVPRSYGRGQLSLRSAGGVGIDNSPAR